MSIKGDPKVEEALKQGKLVVIRGYNECKIRIVASDPSKIKVIERK